MAVSEPTSPPGILFDLDGTLIDSVYMHVLAWYRALARANMLLSVWRIHRRIGMSGGLLLHALARELGRKFTDEEIERIQTDHEAEYLKMIDQVKPLPGADDLLARLAAVGVPFAIATSGRASKAMQGIGKLALPQGVPIVTRDDVRRAKPDPDLFLAAAQRLGLAPENCLVVGDSVWDILAARRARALGIGLLAGGYGREELQEAGAFRVYEDPKDLLEHLDEVGVREA
jgi:HAD superfamily hydrolase (TIGR01509 family)